MNDTNSMDTNPRYRHCDEVELLMKGETPLVTRHGVSIVIAIIATSIAILFIADGAPRRIAKGMIEHVQNRIIANPLPTDIKGL